MKNIAIIFFLVSLFIACQKADNLDTLVKNEQGKTSTQKDAPSNSQMIKRGAYLVTAAGCNDCHSPKVMTATGPVPDKSRLLSGHPSEDKIAPYDPAIIQNWALFNHQLTAAIGPWGVSFAANITSDETGIGMWEEAQFLRALKQGKFKGLENGRTLLPPMPWENYAQLTDEDLKAIFAYLKSTKAVRNIVPVNIPPASGGTH